MTASAPTVAYRSFLIRASASSQPGIAVVIVIALFDIIGTAALFTSIIMLAGPFFIGAKIAAVTWLVHTILWQAGVCMFVGSRIMALTHGTMKYSSAKDNENPFSKDDASSRNASIVAAKPEVE